MDVLTACYKSNMRLFADRPDVLVAGRWYWCPPGAVAVPYLHRFASKHFDYDGFRLDDNSVGEVSVIPGYTDGIGNARYTGQHWCGSESAWTQGVLFAQAGTPASDEDGVPFCCNAGQERGGDQVEGSAGWPVVPNPDLWYWPPGIAGVTVGQPIVTWPDDSGHGRNGTSGIPAARPIRVDGPGGWPAARFAWDTHLNFLLLTATSELSAFFVETPLTAAPNLARVNGIIDLVFFLLVGVNGYPGGPVFQDTLNNVGVGTDPVLLQTELMAFRRTPSEVKIYRNGELVQTAGLISGGVQDFVAFSSTQGLSMGIGLVDLSEVRLYAQSLTDLEFGAVQGELLNRYGIVP